MARLMAVKVLPSPGVGLITASVFQPRCCSRCSTCVRSILKAWPAGPLASAGMTPLARSTDGSMLATRVCEKASASCISAGAGGSVSVGTAARSFRPRSARASSRAFCRRSILALDGLKPWNHGERWYRQQGDDVLAAADARIEALEQLHHSAGRDQREQSPHNQYQRPIWAHGLLRFQRRLDQRKPLPLALGFEIRGELGFHLLLVNLGMLLLGARQVAPQGIVIALDHGGRRATLLKLGPTRTKLNLLREQRGALGLRGLAGGLNLDIRRVIGSLPAHRGRRIAWRIF